MNFKGPVPISYSNDLRFGRCGDLVNLVVHILRSLGIPATSDFTPQWGNHHRAGHDWLVLIDRDEEYYIDVFDRSSLNHVYKESSLPRVYRKDIFSNKRIYNMPCTDVTNEYREVNSLEFEFDEEIDSVHVCVFQGGGVWFPVDFITNYPVQKVNNLVDNVVYNLKLFSGEVSKPIFYPVLFKNGKLFDFRSGFDNTVKVQLTRKYPPYFVRDYFWKQWWLKSIDQCKI